MVETMGSIIKSISYISILSFVFTTSGWLNHANTTCPSCLLKNKQVTKACCDKEHTKSDCCSSSKESEQETEHRSNCTCCFLGALPDQERKAIISYEHEDKEVIKYVVNSNLKPYSTFTVSSQQHIRYRYYNNDLSTIPRTIPLLI